MLVLEIAVVATEVILFVTVLVANVFNAPTPPVSAAAPTANPPTPLTLGSAEVREDTPGIAGAREDTLGSDGASEATLGSAGVMEVMLGRLVVSEATLGSPEVSPVTPGSVGVFIIPPRLLMVVFVNVGFFSPETIPSNPNGRTGNDEETGNSEELNIPLVGIVGVDGSEKLGADGRDSLGADTLGTDGRWVVTVPVMLVLKLGKDGAEMEGIPSMLIVVSILLHRCPGHRLRQW